MSQLGVITRRPVLIGQSGIHSICQCVRIWQYLYGFEEIIFSVTEPASSEVFWVFRHSLIQKLNYSIRQRLSSYPLSIIMDGY